MNTEEVFPRPCKNCGNPVEVYKGKLVHSYRKRERCRVFRRYDLERDENGAVNKMIWRGDVPLPDPPTKEQREQAQTQAAIDRLAEWNRIYGHGAGKTEP